ncbi:hypothetical protein E2C01_071364 [Portunus trituberculatus]|uniref:Uncharacterized protein n=1 Tax=Portunus trituberculatus TaxID=210409 RepID=A0A5B7I7T5_PORTR|nr:hypothetical protein [Portunus trituberculatus]
MEGRDDEREVSLSRVPMYYLWSWMEGRTEGRRERGRDERTEGWREGEKEGGKEGRREGVEWRHKALHITSPAK